jgi:hypothetical protein
MRIQQLLLLVGFIGALFSCEWKERTKTMTREFVEAELKTIDWNQLDQFPLFDSCDETSKKEVQQECFQTTLVTHLSMALQDFKMQSTSKSQDTLFVDFKVDSLGIITVLNITGSIELINENGDFQQFVSQSLKQLPRLHPPLKRGIPVVAQFRVPLVIRVNE